MGIFVPYHKHEQRESEIDVSSTYEFNALMITEDILFDLVKRCQIEKGRSDLRRSI